MMTLVSGLHPNETISQEEFRVERLRKELMGKILS